MESSLHPLRFCACHVFNPRKDRTRSAILWSTPKAYRSRSSGERRQRPRLQDDARYRRRLEPIRCQSTRAGCAGDRTSCSPTKATTTGTFAWPAQAAHHPAHCPLRHQAQDRLGRYAGWLNAPSPGSTASGAELVGEVARYEDKYRLCYMRGPSGIIVALAEELF
jgi:hypothetical protein